MIQKFSLGNIESLDGGRVCEAWDQAIKRAALDCDDRPGLKKPRKVVLELELVPRGGTGGSLESIDGVFKITDTTPKRETKTHNFNYRTQRGEPVLVFNDMSEDDANQMTIDQQEETTASKLNPEIAMIKEAIDRLNDLFKVAHSPQIIHQTPKEIHYTLAGEPALLEIGMHANHVVRSLASMVDAAEQFKGKESTLWHGDGAITLAIDELSSVAMYLNLSQQFIAIRELTAKMDQRSVVRFLSHTLNDCVDDTVVASFRRISFKRSSDGSASIEHGKESLGRAVEEVVNSTDTLPETIVANIPVYDEDGLRGKVPVRMSVDVNTSDETFRITPFPGELAKAMDDAQHTIHEALAVTGLPVFRGSPGHQQFGA